MIVGFGRRSLKVCYSCTLLTIAFLPILLKKAVFFKFFKQKLVAATEGIGFLKILYGPVEYAFFAVGKPSVVEGLGKTRVYARSATAWCIAPFILPL